jgi:hypothetical protein
MQVKRNSAAPFGGHPGRSQDPAARAAELARLREVAS